MTALSRILAIAAATAAMPSLAHAHLGHVGELAGHSHWLGLGALAAAAAAIALLPKKRRKDDERAGGDSEAGDEPAGEEAA